MIRGGWLYPPGLIEAGGTAGTGHPPRLRAAQVPSPPDRSFSTAALTLFGMLLTGGMAEADDVPLASAYGTLSSCVLWLNHAERTNGIDYSFILLTGASLTGVEWACSFGK